MNRFRADLLLAMAIVGACSGVEPDPEIISISPDQSYTDREINLTLTGRAFVPSSNLKPVSGDRQAFVSGFQGRVGRDSLWVNLVDFSWHSTSEIKAKLTHDRAKELPAGTYDVEITDPRGATSHFPHALTLHGPDALPPELIVASLTPTAVIGAGMEIHTSAVATDTTPGQIHQIEWRYSISGIPQREDRCVATSAITHLSCSIDFTVDPAIAPGTEITLEIWAEDTAMVPNRSTLLRHYLIAPPPSVFSITPTYGGAIGGTEIIVKGSDFLPGSRAFLGGIPLIPEGGIWVDKQTLTGHAPPHPDGPVDLLFQGPFGQSIVVNAFVYRPAPMIIRVTPEQGPPGTAVVITGENFTDSTLISFGSMLQSSLPLERPYLQNSNAIVGLVPFDIGKTIVWAFDPELGFSKLLGGYTFVSQ